MSIGGWLREPVVDPTGLQWPRWVPSSVSAAAAVVAIGALVQRDALVPPGTEALVALVAVSPWLLETVTQRSVPGPLFAIPVIAGTIALLNAPAQSDVSPFLLVLLALEIGATSRPVVSVPVIATACIAITLLEAHEQYGGWWVWVPGIVGGGVAGLAAQSQLRLFEQERATRRALAERLAAEDRRRVAREVHDVIAHSLGVTMLHITAARHALESDADIDEAVDSLREAERLGREAMGDIRRTVGLLDGTPRGDRPLPGAADLPRLVDELRAAGMDVSYHLSGDPGRLSPALALDVYRVAQESLANVAKHTPGGRAEVVVDVGRDALELRVDSAGGGTSGPATAGGPTRRPRPRGESRPPDRRDPGGSRGRGIRGMTERVERHGGCLQAGPLGTGWRVAASVPLEPPRP